MSELKIGDVVVLKSGGPKMTVAYIGNSGKIDCVWFKESNEKRGTFHVEAVQKYVKPRRQAIRPNFV